MNFEIGKSYKTKGGWRALIIYVYTGTKKGTFEAIHFGPSYNYDFLHNLATNEEWEMICSHDEKGKALTAFSVNERPCYFDHPANLTGKEWSKND